VTVSIDLQARFVATLVQAAGTDHPGTGPGADRPRPRQQAAAADLVARWQEPHRRYHTLTHLIAVLDALEDLLAEPGGLPVPDPPVVRLAAWFHDAVHAGRPGQDEEASAVLADRVLTELGLPPGQVAAVARLVRMTSDHRPEPGDLAAEALADADLAVLAAPPRAYQEYATAVRREYAHVPQDAFRAGRAEVLRRLTAGEWIYHTVRGRALWETGARANVAAELERLRPRPPE
jgi:predicted metal-dependent HD superfamily phosphohydrolase